MSFRIDEDAFDSAAQLIANADGLLVSAGAGMGVDSGLPDFRGPQGFWKAYPALGRASMCFEAIASPDAFREDSRLAWGFYGHRLSLYRRTIPHDGFRILREIGARLPLGAFVFTSNVDGQFEKAGFAADRICECHGSIHRVQCLVGCLGHVWPADAIDPEVDEAQCRLRSALPRCIHCKGVARPNVLMFGDWGWLGQNSVHQQGRLRVWLGLPGRRVIVEIGAGGNIPTVRRFSESRPEPLIRINPREPELPDAKPGISLPMGGLEALRRIDARLDRLGFWERPLLASAAAVAGADDRSDEARGQQ